MWESDFKNTMLKSSSCDYSHTYIIVKRRIAVTVAGDNAGARKADERYTRVTFKNFAPFINC